jgi:DNA polymerase elongation subunit (family B)
MSGLFGVRETVTHVPAVLRVQLLDPLVRDHNGQRDRRAVLDAGRPVTEYNHADHRCSRVTDALAAAGGRGVLVDRELLGDGDGGDGDDCDDDDGYDEGQRRVPPPPEDSLLLLNGVDSEGRTVCVRVTGMRYSIYVRCPDHWTIVHMRALAQMLESYYRIPAGGIECRQKARCHVIGWEPERIKERPGEKGAAGATPRRAPQGGDGPGEYDLTTTRAHNYCVLGFGSARVMEWAANAIEDPNKLRRRRLREPLTAADIIALRVYERRVDPVHKALERMEGLQPCSWFDVTRWTVPGLYHTHAQIEVETHWTNIVPRPEINDMAPLWKASWDVECFSADGSFPRADHPQNTDYTICINTYFRQHRSDGRPSRVVQTSHHFGPVEIHRLADPAVDLAHPPREITLPADPAAGRPRPLIRKVPGWGVRRVEAATVSSSSSAEGEGADTVYVMQCETELEAIEGWRDLIVLDIQPSVVEGYNTDAFDFGWLGTRAEVQAGYGKRSRLFEAGVIIGEHTPMRRKDLDSAAKGSNTLNFIPMPGRILIDMYHIVKVEKRLESYTLDDVCKSIFPDDPTMRKIDVPPADIFAHYASGDGARRGLVVDYCARDCRLPMALEEIMRTLTSIVEMAKITRTPLPLMLISGQQVKTWSQIVYEAHRMRYVVNAPEGRTGGGGGGNGAPATDWLRSLYSPEGVSLEWLAGVVATGSAHLEEGGGRGAGARGAAAAAADDGYKGATVLDPRAGYYDVPIVTLDYQSLYPSIMEGNNLCPSTLVTDPDVIAALRAACVEIEEPIAEVRRLDGTSTTALNRLFASRPDWRPGQFGGGVVAFREVTPSPGRAHIFVQHVEGVVPHILTALKLQRRLVRSEQKDYAKGSPVWCTLEGRQLGIKITANCFPAEDHEILTERGFMNHAAVVEHFRHHDRLGVGCYVDGQLQYHDIDESRVITGEGTHHLVCFESEGKNGVSIRCTANHRMYARVGPTRLDDKWRESREWEGDAPPFSIYTASEIVEAGIRDPSTMVQFAAVCDKGVARGGGRLPFVEALGLKSDDEIDAFIELYGYWLGDGWLQSSSQAIGFSPLKTADSVYLARLFGRLGLPVLTDAARGSSAYGVYIAPEPERVQQPRRRYETWTKPHCHYIYGRSWWRYFAQQYGHKYASANALEAAMEGALRNGTDLPARRPFPLPAVSQEKLLAAAPTGRVGRPPAAFIAQRNRTVNGVAERICYGKHCVLAGQWQPLEEAFSGRTRRGSKTMVYEGKCKRCMAANAVKHHAQKKRRIAEAYDAMAAAPKTSKTLAPDAEDGKSARWMWSWVWTGLGRDRLRLLLRGLRMADGDSATGERAGGVIYTCSRRFAEEVARVALHAGYAPLIRPTCAKGQMNGRNRNGVPIIATRRNWAVHYSETERCAYPKLRIIQDVTITAFTGTVWCVTVPTESHLIIVRRLLDRDGERVPSRPLILQNSCYGFLGAVKRGRMPCVQVSESVTCIGRDMIMATKAYVETHIDRYLNRFVRETAEALCDRARRRMEAAFEAAGLGPVRSTEITTLSGEPIVLDATTTTTTTTATSGASSSSLVPKAADRPSLDSFDGLFEALGAHRSDDDDIRNDDGLDEETKRDAKNARALMRALGGTGLTTADITGATVVYGDSVSADTPLLVRRGDGRIDCVRVDGIIDAADPRWLSHHSDGKEAVDLRAARGDSLPPSERAPGPIEVWTERGWTAIKRVIRHRAGKRMYRVTTRTGRVDVTEDHSLLDERAQKVAPRDLAVGSRLLHADLPRVERAPGRLDGDMALAWSLGLFYACGSCAPSSCHGADEVWSWRMGGSVNADLLRDALDAFARRHRGVEFRVREARDGSGACAEATGPGAARLSQEHRTAFYEPRSGDKRVPPEVLNASRAVQAAFLRGYIAGTRNGADRGECRVDPADGKIGPAGIYYLLAACGYEVVLDACPGEDDAYVIRYRDASAPCAGEKPKERDDPNVIARITALDPPTARRDGGQDRIPYVYDLETENHHFAAGVGRLVVHNTDSVMIKFHGVPKTRAGVDVALQLGVAASAYITGKFPDQIVLDTEKAYWPYALFRKKRYAGRMWTLEGKPPEVDAKGVEVKRRDNWAGLRKTYKECLRSMMEEMDIDAVKDIVLRLVDDLRRDRVPLEDYMISKSLKRDYSKCKSPPPHVVVRDKIKARNPGSEPLAGNRVFFVITADPKIAKVSARAEDPKHVVDSDGRVKIDRLYYLNSLVRPFGALLEPCFENPEALFRAAAVEIENQQKGQRPISAWLAGRRRSPCALPRPPPPPAADAASTEAGNLPLPSPHGGSDPMVVAEGGGAKRPREDGSDGNDKDDDESAQRARIASRVQRRRTDEGYVPAAVVKERKRLANKAAREAPRPTSGPITAFLRRKMRPDVS